MVRNFKVEERHIHLNAVGTGDVITVPHGVVKNWVLTDIGLEGIYELEFDIEPSIKCHNMYENKSWYRICNSSTDQPILKRIEAE